MTTPERASLKEAYARYAKTHRPCRDCLGLGFLPKGDEGGDRCETCDGKGAIRLTPQEFEAQPFDRDWPIVLTPQQKMQALSNRFYSRQGWEPKAGDLYTTSRADLELYEVVKVDRGVIYTRYRNRPDSLISEWRSHEFLSAETFGYARTHVPKWIFL